MTKDHKCTVPSGQIFPRPVFRPSFYTGGCNSLCKESVDKKNQQYKQKSSILENFLQKMDFRKMSKFEKLSRICPNRFRIYHFYQVPKFRFFVKIVTLVLWNLPFLPIHESPWQIYVKYQFLGPILPHIRNFRTGSINFFLFSGNSIRGKDNATWVWKKRHTAYTFSYPRFPKKVFCVFLFVMF